MTILIEAILTCDRCDKEQPVKVNTAGRFEGGLPEGWKVPGVYYGETLPHYCPDCSTD